MTGHTTPAVRDVGGASLRVKFPLNCSLDEGGFVLAVRREPDLGWLPAIAGVPGHQGLDRQGNSRVGLAELMIMARPVVPAQTEGPVDLTSVHAITFLPHDNLEELFPVGSTLEIAELSKLTNFFLGLNAGGKKFRF